VHEWILGLCNAYSRLNPIRILYEEKLEEKIDKNGYWDENKVVDRTLTMMKLFPIIPSVS